MIFLYLSQFMLLIIISIIFYRKKFDSCCCHNRGPRLNSCIYFSFWGQHIKGRILNHWRSSNILPQNPPSYHEPSTVAGPGSWSRGPAQGPVLSTPTARLLQEFWPDLAKMPLLFFLGTTSGSQQPKMSKFYSTTQRGSRSGSSKNSTIGLRGWSTFMNCTMQVKYPSIDDDFSDLFWYIPGFDPLPVWLPHLPVPRSQSMHHLRIQWTLPGVLFWRRIALVSLLHKHFTWSGHMRIIFYQVKWDIDSGWYLGPFAWVCNCTHP